MANEALLKAYILSRGVQFTQAALDYAILHLAKQQNLVYNAPKGYAKSRPQELLITGPTGYTVVASCTAPHDEAKSVWIDTIGDRLVAIVDDLDFSGLSLAFVPEPGYYDKVTQSGTPLKRLVSACGLDELNIWPWHDCAISHKCTFCGVNKILRESESDDLLTAFAISRSAEHWDQRKAAYLQDLKEAVQLAYDDDCYKEHLHLILIGGNLANDQLDRQAIIFTEIAGALHEVMGPRSTEGVVAVMMPPKDPSLLRQMKDGGIDIVVFNLEVAQEPYFSQLVPGKSRIGRDLIIERLEQSVPIFGRNKVWCNFVFGLEPVDGLLAMCEYLASKGITPGANVLHLDHGSSLHVVPPSVDEILYFYQQLAQIYRKHDLTPYYCQKALRTGLANEAFHGRLDALLYLEG